MGLRGVSLIEAGHGVEIVLLSGGEAIKAHAENIAIQRITGLIAGFVHIGQGDPGALRCGLPSGASSCTCS